jgi:hypothetical protein
VPASKLGRHIGWPVPDRDGSGDGPLSPALLRECGHSCVSVGCEVFVPVFPGALAAPWARLRPLIQTYAPLSVSADRTSRCGLRIVKEWVTDHPAGASPFVELVAIPAVAVHERHR